MELPENLRPAIAFVRKHQFWLVLALMPCVLIPTLFTARATLDGQIRTNRGRIKSKIDLLNGVERKSPHPNAQWKTAVDAETDRIRRDTFDEWRKLWDSQAEIRVWPRELGDPFIAQVTNLRPGGFLDVTARNRYQTDVRLLVKQLPERMGAEERMVEQPAAGDVGANPVRGRRQFRVAWRPENQRMIYQWFDWPSMPDDGKAATAQIIQAQEELWVYGLLCDAIRRANKAADTRFNATIVGVEELLVGYPAAEESPGGQGQRLYRAQAGIDVAGPMGGQSQNFPKPSHPRFSGGAGRSGAPPPFIPGTAPPPGPPAAADAAYRGAIYVDFNGKWLSAAELDAGGPRMMHLMPFTLRMVMDDRKIGALLADLASQSIPIDVRQLRINPSNAGTPGGPAPGGVRQPADPSDERKFDATVEIRGTVGLATPPVEKPAGGPPPGPPNGAAIGPGGPRPSFTGRRGLVSSTSTAPS